MLSQSTSWASNSGPSTQANLTFAAHGDAASAAHAGSVDHDGVEGCHRGDAEFLREQRGELHHERGTDDDCLVDVRPTGHESADRVSHESLGTIRSVVGGNNKLVADITHVVFKNEQVVRPRPKDGNDAVAGFLHGLRNGIQRSCSDATACTQNDAEPLDMCRSAQRSHDVVNRIPGPEHGHLARGLADGLDDQRDGPHVDVCIGDSQRNPFTVIGHPDDDELPGLPVRRDERRVDDIPDDVLSQLFSFADRIHACLLVFQVDV